MKRENDFHNCVGLIPGIGNLATFFQDRLGHTHLCDTHNTQLCVVDLVIISLYVTPSPSPSPVWYDVADESLDLLLILLSRSVY